MDESIMCTNCGLKYRPMNMDNFLEICESCQISMGIRKEDGS